MFHYGNKAANLKTPSAGAQRGFDGGVARQGGGVVVLVKEHGVDLKLDGQPHDLVARDAV